ILNEGKLLNREPEGQLIANELRNVKDKTTDEILKLAIHLYSVESFLYKLVNSTLRADDRSQIDTLGAYCYLLDRYFSEYHTIPLNNVPQNNKRLTVYRGATLTDEMIDAYEKVVGTCIKWSAFTSTSKDPKVAEQFDGNTLFIIQLGAGYIRRSDISSLSYYPEEQEVLLDAASHFQVDKLEYNSKSGKYLIYLTDGSTSYRIDTRY
ncbi:unnamed protein product, partial [Didymodactylos carnosus]